MGLLDVGDRRVDLEGLGDCLAALGAQPVAPEAKKGGHNRLWKALMRGPINNEIETRRMRAYLMLVIDVLTLRASATALPPSAPSLLYPRLQKGTP